MGVFSRILGNNNQEGGKKRDDDKKQTSRMEQRLRTARILEGDDDDDDEPNRRRMQAQIERDLNDPKVHKQIVENLYGAYKIRVRLYIVFLFALSFVLCCFLFQDSQLREESDDVENRLRSFSLSLSFLSLFRFRERDRVDARCVDDGTDFATDGFKTRDGFFIRRRRRTRGRGRETLKEIGSERKRG